MLKKAIICMAAVFCSASMRAVDNGDGTFSNPVVWADMPDPDVIRVGDTFYMVFTTMHLMPGGPIMKSKDLVNWELSSYLFDELRDTPRYDITPEGGTVYGHGQWATSLRYNDGKYYALFSANDEPYKSAVYVTDDPDNGWTLLSRLPHYHDCSLFFDDDGRVYTISGSGSIWLKELQPDLMAEKEGGIKMELALRDAEENGLHEGSRMVKHDGKYYLFIISWPQGKPRRQLCYRSDNIEGPYEKRVVLEDNFLGFPYVAQGTIVDDADGNWWAMIFQDRNAIGRVPTLSPVEWRDGWPVIGNDGKVPETYTKPVQGEKPLANVHSDDFSGSLDPYWQWNHNPRLQLVSLTDRNGWLRLHTGEVAKSIFHAHNTLSQRMEGPKCSGEIKMDVSNMTDGDVAGLSAFNGHTGQIGVEQEGDDRYLVYRHIIVDFSDGKVISGTEDNEIARIPLAKGQDEVLLRINADFNLGSDLATFAYSVDGGNNWLEFEEPMQMRFDYRKLFMGTRFAIYNYCSKQPGGFVDIDYFHYNCER